MHILGPCGSNVFGDMVIISTVLAEVLEDECWTRTMGSMRLTIKDPKVQKSRQYGWPRFE